MALLSLFLSCNKLQNRLITLVVIFLLNVKVVFPEARGPTKLSEVLKFQFEDTTEHSKTSSATTLNENLKHDDHDEDQNVSYSPTKLSVDSVEYGATIDAKLREVFDLLQGDSNKVDAEIDTVRTSMGLSKESDDKTVFNQVLNMMQISKNNADVITQAFRFVRLDAHLSTLLNLLAHLSDSQKTLHAESIKQQTKFNLVLDEIRNLAANFAKESVRLTEVEERLESEMETMSDRVDTAIEKIIQSAVSTQILLDLAKETIQQTDKSVGISNEVLIELKSVRTELGDVGQASVQAIYNVQKLEESLLMALEETGNKTIYALRQDQQLHYQLLPLASPMKMDVDEVSLVPLGNGSIGNSMQADGTILAESTSLSASSPAAASVTSTSSSETGPYQQQQHTNIANTASSPTHSFLLQLPKPEEEVTKQKAQQNIMHDTNGRNEKTGGTSKTSSVRKNMGKSILQQSLVSPCPSLYERKISSERPRNCEEIQISINEAISGVYRIYPDDSKGMEYNGTDVYCDLLTDGGGWTVIQRRKEPLLMEESFERTWHEYSTGFGILHDSHWLGLDIISHLTQKGEQVLRVDMTDWQESSRVAQYSYFRIANSTELFKIFVTDYSGNAGDSLAYHNGMAFTTIDKDNDLEKNVNCARKYSGAWWHKSCHQSNLNGRYMDESNGKHDSYAIGVNWYSWHGYYYSLKRAEMKIRSRHFQPLP